MGEHKEELGCVISMFKGAITREQRVCAPAGTAAGSDCGGTQGFTPSEGKGLRDPFRADNNEFIYYCVDAQCPGHAPPLAFPRGIVKVGEDL